MKLLTPDPRQNWPPEGEIFRIGEFRKEWLWLTGPKATQFITAYRSKGEGRYVISGEMVGGVRHIALLHFRDRVVQFTTINMTFPDRVLLVEQLSVAEFWRRFGLAQVHNPYRNDFAQEATIVIWETLHLGNRGRHKFELENLDAALSWLGNVKSRQKI